MTIKEAIEILRKHDPWPLWSVEAHDAIDMAISALEKQEGKKPNEAKNVYPQSSLSVRLAGVAWADTKHFARLMICLARY